MKKGSLLPASQGPFRAGQIRPGDPYELSHGHPILCLPTGGRGSKASGVGASVLASDPAVRDVGFDTGFSPAPDTLRAPDLSVGEIPDEPGWVQGAPPLAVEYADTGQDEQDLAVKIQELLAAGTQLVWVVRMTGPRHVEIHTAGKDKRVARPGDELVAPGILANPVPVEALYDREAAREVILRNLLQREGYASLEDIEVQRLRKSILDVLSARGLAVDDDLRAALAGVNKVNALEVLLRQAAVASAPAEVLAAIRG